MTGLYHYPPTWLHTMPAGSKLLALALLSIAVMAINDLLYLAAGLAVVCLLYCGMGILAARRLRLLLQLWPVLLVIFLGQFYTSGVYVALASIIRLALMILLADLVTMSTPMQAMMDAFSALLSPLRGLGINTSRLSFCVALIIRFVPLVLDLWRSQSEAWRARTGKRAGWRMIAPFIANVMRMADRVAESLDARGFGVVTSTSPRKCRA